MPTTIRNLDAAPITDVLAPSADMKPTTSGCCGGAAPAGADACCARDAEVKAAGGSGCGCGATPTLN